MRMNITLRQLRVFCAVYELRNFTSAADFMHMTQSAVSKLCAELESEVGFPLFERSTRRVTPCDGAAELYGYAQEVINTMHAASRNLSALRSLERGSISIASSPMMMYGLLRPVIERFIREHPGVTLDLHELSTDDTVEFVRTGKGDFGVVSISDPDPQLNARVIYRESMALACSPAHVLSKRKLIQWKEVAELHHITLRSVYSVRRTVDRILRAQGLELRSSIQAGTLTTALGMVSSNLGVTLIPDYAAEFAQQIGLNVVKIAEAELHQHELSLLTRRGVKPTLAAAAFIDMLDAHLGV